MMGLAPGVTTTCCQSVSMPRTSRLLRATAWRSSGQAGRGPVVRVAVLEGLHAGGHDVLRRIEVGLADFQVDDFPALGFQSAGFRQHLKGAFSPQTAHASGDRHGVMFLKTGSRCGFLRKTIPHHDGLVERISLAVNPWERLMRRSHGFTAYS